VLLCIVQCSVLLCKCSVLCMAGAQVPVYRLLCIAVQCITVYGAVQCVCCVQSSAVCYCV
jgi:hypothetical protein